MFYKNVIEKIYLSNYKISWEKMNKEFLFEDQFYSLFKTFKTQIILFNIKLFKKMKLSVFLHKNRKYKKRHFLSLFKLKMQLCIKVFNISGYYACFISSI